MSKMKRNKKIFATVLALVLTASTVISTAISVSAEIIPDSSTPEYTAYICDTDNGTAAFKELGDGTTEMMFHEGDTVKVETSADEGYEFSDAYITGVEDASGLDYREKNGTVSFTMPDRDVLVYVDFQKTGDSDVSEEDGWQDDTVLDDSAGDETVVPEGTKIISSFTMDCDMYAVSRGEYEYEEIVEMLPDRIEAVLSDGTEKTVEIAEWTCSNREMLDAETEDDVTLCFTGELPEGYMLDSSDPELRPPGVMLRVMDPYGISLMADTTKYLDKGGIIYYGGYNTHRYVYGGREAYCANPSKSSPRSGNYSASVISDYGNAAAIWFAYGSPGFDASLYPSTWYDGTAMTPDRYRALSHIIISDRLSGDGYYAYGQCSATFRNWVQNYVIGYSINGGAVTNTNALKYKIDHYQFGANGGSNTWPEGFTAYTIYTGNSSQSMVSFDYTPSNPPSPVYQVANYKCRQGVVPSMDLYINKSDCDTGEKLAGAVFDVYMDGTKVSSVTTDSSGAAVYHWRGSTLNTAYAQSGNYSYCVNYDELSSTDKAKVNANSSVYNYRSTAYAAAKTKSVNAANAALVSLKSSTTHKWKVVETKAPEGYALNEEIFEKSFSLTTTAVEVSFTDKKTGYLKLTKASANPSITDDNNCYSLAGAVYAVYTDKTCKEVVTTMWGYLAYMTTDEDGNAYLSDKDGKWIGTDGKTVSGDDRLQSIWMPGEGTYYVKEVTASEGYELDETVYPVKVTNSSTKDTPVQLDVEEIPGNDPIGITMTKIWDGDETPTIPTLEGTQFTIRYYDGYYTEDTLPGTATRTWVIEVKKNSSGKYVARLSDDYLVSALSDELYYDNGFATLPLGTITIQETQPAAGYTLNGYLTDSAGNAVSTDSELYIAQITKDGNDLSFLSGGNEYDGYNTPIYGSIKIKKYDTDGKTPLKDVTFEIVNSAGETVATKTTDKNGEILFDDLYPDVYTITETATVSGHTLLKDPIVAEIPMRVTEQDIKDNNIDKSQCVYDEADDIYYIHNLTFEVGNGGTIVYPMTGGFDTIRTFLPLIAGLIVLMGISVVMLRKKKRV